MAIVNATDQTFTQEVKEGLVLVDFWAPWCGPCRMIAPILEEIDEEMSGSIKIVKVNVDENSTIAAQFQIMSIPALILFKNGEIVETTVGYQSKEALTALISNYAE
ncbi:thioredoxin [Ectobacillus sp. JY-23]|uniref:thioredoxin n=1 Tax=Ectobacillus sp. JY-23 TaxID=2933872 RepID=UPI001FF1990E|nr:thioredoxin [Ectobacillus sp. JY-23]UOY93328.1 thioredoxin [Ectobacillus sp. JY-23]